MLLHGDDSWVISPHLLSLRFDDGDERTVDTGPLLRRTMFEPLMGPAYFARAELEPICRTAISPN